MKVAKKVVCCSMLIVSIVLLFAGCNLFNSTPDLSDDSGAKIIVDESADLKELDLLILRSIYPAGLVDSLAEAEELASGSKARNSFDPDSYNDDIVWSISDTVSYTGWTVTEYAEDKYDNPIYIDNNGDLIYIYDLLGSNVHCFVNSHGDPVFTAEGGETIYYIEDGDDLLCTNRQGGLLVDAAVPPAPLLYTTNNISIPLVDADSPVSFDKITTLIRHEIARNVTPEEAYAISHEFPTVGVYLEQANVIDKTIEGEFFTMEITDDSSYMITFTIVKKLGLSSVDRVETIYYVGPDSWNNYSTEDIFDDDDEIVATRGWASERVYYRNGKIGDRTKINFNGAKARPFFSENPDYGPFNIFTGDPSFQYSNGHNNSGQDWINDQTAVAGQARYSSKTNTKVFPVDTIDFTDDQKAVSEETNYYTEANVTQYPAAISSYNTSPTTSGEVRASIIHYKKPGQLHMVTAGNTYYIGNNFVIKDVKSLHENKTSNPTYPFMYHHKSFYWNSGVLYYNNSFEYFKESKYNNIVDITKDNKLDKKLETKLQQDTDGKWTGTYKISSSAFTTGVGTGIEFNVTLAADGYLNYVSTYLDDDKIERDLIITPVNGIITFTLSSGTFAGNVTLSGILSGVYTPNDTTLDPVYL